MAITDLALDAALIGGSYTFRDSAKFRSVSVKGSKAPRFHWSRPRRRDDIARQFTAAKREKCETMIALGGRHAN